MAEPVALVPESRLLDWPPHGIGKNECLHIARDFDHAIIHTPMPALLNDCRISKATKKQSGTTIGFVGAQAAALPADTSKASFVIDWVGRKESDFT